ncbi:MAG: hydrogenase maturation protease, partial [Euryarchaeota archaeon]|nr:hydrogenase maturation protease [Euryarchaeota archaeon]
MKEENNFNIFIIGIGNENRKDDAIGIKVISVLEKMALSGVQLIKIQDDITDLLNLWANARLVILIDAVIS